MDLFVSAFAQHHLSLLCTPEPSSLPAPHWPSLALQGRSVMSALNTCFHCLLWKEHLGWFLPPGPLPRALWPLWQAWGRCNSWLEFGFSFLFLLGRIWSFLGERASSKRGASVAPEMLPVERIHRYVWCKGARCLQTEGQEQIWRRSVEWWWLTWYPVQRNYESWVTYGNSNRIVMILFTFSSFFPPLFWMRKQKRVQ